jgi:hypothetical protein
MGAGASVVVMVVVVRMTVAVLMMMVAVVMVVTTRPWIAATAHAAHDVVLFLSGPTPGVQGLSGLMVCMAWRCPSSRRFGILGTRPRDCYPYYQPR